MPRPDSKYFFPVPVGAPDVEVFNDGSLTAGAECLYYRLAAKCDDAGRYYAEPVIVAAHLYIRQFTSDPGFARNIGDLLDQLAAVRLIRRYRAGGVAYLDAAVLRILRADVKARLSHPEPPGPDAYLDPGPLAEVPGLALDQPAATDRWPAEVVESIVQAYPKPVRLPLFRQATRRALQRLTESEQDPAAYLLDRVELYAASPEGKGSCTQDPTRWMDLERYLEPVTAWTRAGSAKPQTKSVADQWAKRAEPSSVASSS